MAYKYKKYEESDDVRKAREALDLQLGKKPGDYQSQYKGQLESLYNQVMNRDPFTFDLNGDALYNQYKDELAARGEKYEIVKAINADLQALYAGICGDGEMTSEAVFHVGGDPDELTTPFAGYGKYAAIEGGSLVAGFFAGDKCMLVNKDYKNAVNITVKAEGGLEKLNKATGTWESCDGRFTMAAGDGELIRVI